MRSDLCILAALLFLSLMTVASGSSASVQANVMVTCPFYLSENALSVYPASNSIILNYTIYSQAQCTISSMQGSFILQYSGNSVAVISNSVSVSAVTQNSALYLLPPINALNLNTDSYKAVLSFSSYGSSNASTKSFLLVSPANILITSFTVSPGQVSAGLPITFTANVVNDGGYASGLIGLNIVITGPQNFNVIGSASALSPGQSELVSLMLSDVTGAVGSYTANAYATFVLSNTLMQSNTGSTAYSVTQPVSPSNPNPKPSNPVVTLPQLELAATPFYSSLVLGSSLLSSISFKNIINVPETVILSIPRAFAKIFSLSAYSIYLVPNESVLVQMMFNSNGVTEAGSYVVPVNISVSTQNSTPVNITQYLTYMVEKGSFNTSLYNQISLSHGNATVTTTLMGARNSSLTNATLITMLPSTVVTNASQVTTSGLPATVTTNNGALQIRWLVPYLPPGKAITLSYTISHPTNVGLLESVQNLLIMASVPVPTSILRVVSIQTPTFYANSINTAAVGVLYTGTLQQRVKFVLTTAGAAEVLNPVQFVNASPNQLLQRTFNIKTDNVTGTLLLNLGIETPNASLNYTLPIIVLAKPPSGTGSQTTTPQIAIPVSTLTKYALPIIGVAALLAIAAGVKGRRGRPRYDAERAKELINIREQIKRSDEHA